MDTRDITYEEAERAYAALEAEFEAGQLAEDAYRERLHAIRVRDEHGRTWMIQEGSGQWYVYDEGAWMPATPPGREPTAVAEEQDAPPAMRVSASSPASSRASRTRWPRHGRGAVSAAARQEPGRARQRAPRRRRLGCLAITWRIFLWDVIWLIVGYTVYSIFGQRQPWTLVLVALAAALTLTLWVRRMTPRVPEEA